MALSVPFKLQLVFAIGLIMFTTLSMLPKPAEAQSFTVLYNFSGSTDGAYPLAGLFMDEQGNLYGTTFDGGAHGNGVVFRLDTSGKETVLHSFSGGIDGARPYAPLVRDSAGNLYGTASEGGNLACNPSYGCGDVFKIDNSGKFKVLHRFAGGASDGCEPQAGLTFDREKEYLYGATPECGTFDHGTVFRVGKTGATEIIHNFAGPPSDGADPEYGSLVADAQDNLYGTTAGGGSLGNGTVFKLDRDGESLLYSFVGYPTDGCGPNSTPAIDSDGELYGAANSCGSGGLGMLWRVGANGKETVIHTFEGGVSDGAYPAGGLTIDGDSLIGDTLKGGSSDLGFGTVYQLTADGAIKLLHIFVGSDGDEPAGSLLLDKKGNIYGVASSGGTAGFGTVFRITP